MERGTHMNDTQLPPIIYSYNNSANYSPQFDGTSINSSSNDRNDPAMLRIIREEELLAKVPYVIENEMIKLFQGNTDNNGITVTSKSYPFRESKRYGDKIHQLTETTNKEPIYENVGPTFENNDYVNMPLSTSTNDYTQGGGYYYYTIDSNTNSNQIPQKPRKTRKSKSHQHQVVNVQQNGIDNTQTFTQKQLEQYFVQQQQLSSSSNFDPQSQQYVTQLLQQNGYILQPMSSDAWTALFNPSNQIQHQQQQQQQQQQQNDIAVNENSVEVTPATTNRSSRSHRGQPVYFADRLTNPAFSVDKELLTNTIANQFGYDINSPQLQQLVQNQHLFAARRRTFANMVWQLTPDEELALLSSSSSSTNHLSQNDSDTTTTNQNNNNNQMNGSNGNGKSILKKEYIKNKPPIIPSTNTTAYNKRKNVSFTNPTFYVS
ncbi:unnamed protein product [Didymodactylos carnosus]|uniref:Uncharacterized protein n=1 Tax=Didymodactylos carnosus TaxID=1234261 RepID=A0A8S2JZY1_9BILA|nr:unnamed protein product [Didymodactylos carnosus]CAF3821803.1 unnamed protein product [Didymodactylos carnosus]